MCKKRLSICYDLTPQLLQFKAQTTKFLSSLIEKSLFRQSPLLVRWRILYLRFKAKLNKTFLRRIPVISSKFSNKAYIAEKKNRKPIKFLLSYCTYLRVTQIVLWRIKMYLHKFWPPSIKKPFRLSSELQKLESKVNCHSRKVQKKTKSQLKLFKSRYIK